MMLLGCQNSMPHYYEKSIRKGIRSGLEISLIRGEESNTISSPKRPLLRNGEVVVTDIRDRLASCGLDSY